MTTQIVDSTAETSNPAATAAALERLLSYTPKDPDEPISEGQTALMQRFELRVRKGMTKGKANRAIQQFFQRNPAVAEEYLLERARRRREWWISRQKEYVALAFARSQQTNRVPATERQIGALMVAAFIRRDLSEGQQIEARTLLNYGASSAMASTFLDQLPKREEEVEPN
jgi:hypothetical protein